MPLREGIQRDGELRVGHRRVSVPTVRTALHTLNLFVGMESVFEILGEDAAAARERLWIETYIYRHDAAGRCMAESLAAAAARGVDVRLLYDALGSWRTDKAFFADLVRRGIKVRAYRPLPVVLRELDPWPRDHSRIVVSDGVAYTGGLAWGEEWLTRSGGGRGWHDAGLRVRGPCVEDFAAVFEQRWAEAAGDVAPGDYTTAGRYPDLELITDSPASHSTIYTRHCERIERATSRVWLENSYFLPPRELAEALFAAAARGVDVRLILPRQTDLKILRRAARDEYREWLECGLKIYEYRPSILHSKMALIDDDWATVGTFNANLTSLICANELNLLVFDRGFVEKMAQMFQRDLRKSMPVTEELLKLRTRGNFPRLGNALANSVVRLIDCLTWR